MSDDLLIAFLRKEARHSQDAGLDEIQWCAKIEQAATRIATLEAEANAYEKALTRSENSALMDAERIRDLKCELAKARRVIEAAKPLFDDIVATVGGWQRDPASQRHPPKLGWTPSKSRCEVAYAIYDAIQARAQEVSGGS